MSTVTNGSDQPRTAVVCDDDPVVRRIVSAVLQRSGYSRVEQTEFASEAVDLAQSLQPDVIVLDLTLEGESGLEVIPELRAIAPDSRIVVYSGTEAMKVPARRAGAHAVLSKVSMASVSDLERAVTEGAPS
ncbi:MAG TPA: response regulator [Acidimicrobiales bacterium]|nr:response regulator [Acidimicrobiales bacterium]